MAAVGIPECQAYICLRIMIDRRQLIKPDATVPVGQRARQFGRDRIGLAALVDHHEVVAQPMHFHERQAGAVLLIHHGGDIYMHRAQIQRMRWRGRAPGCRHAGFGAGFLNFGP